MHDNGDVPILTEEEELARIDEGWQTENRRESHAERQAARWFWVAVGLMVVVAALGIWDHLAPRERVEAFVTIIREKDDGQVILIEPLKPLKEYVVTPEAIMFMLARLVPDLRRLGTDEVDEKDRRRNVDAAVCGPAVQQVEMPPKRDADKVAVNLEGIVPTASPRTYRASWEETWQDSRGRVVHQPSFMADLTVARRDLDWSKRDSMAVYVRNPLSLCLQSIIIHEVP